MIINECISISIIHHTYNTYTYLLYLTNYTRMITNAVVFTAN